VRLDPGFLSGGFSAEHFLFANFNSSVANFSENISARLALNSAFCFD
jgi:hypothetical protein